MNDENARKAAKKVAAVARKYSQSFIMGWWTQNGSVLGKGTFGIVYKGQYNGESVAIKRIILDSAETAVNINREVQAQQRLNHPNVLKLYAFAEDDRFR